MSQDIKESLSAFQKGLSPSLQILKGLESELEKRSDKILKLIQELQGTDSPFLKDLDRFAVQMGKQRNSKRESKEGTILVLRNAVERVMKR